MPYLGVAMRTLYARFCLCFTLIAALKIYAQDYTLRTKGVQIKAYDASFYKLIDKKAKAFVLYDKGIWLEGPIMLPDKSLIFSDVKANKVLRYEKNRGVGVYLSPSHFQNGHTLDTNGSPIAASHGKRSIERFENGKWDILVDSYQGKKFNSPNDCIVHSNGDIYFTDPAFGINNTQESYGGKIEQDGEYVYRYTPKNKKLVRLHTPLLKAPNGLALSPDEKTLYIADSQRAYNTKDSTLHAQIIAYTLGQDKNLSEERVFATFKEGFPDGIKVDSLGNVWASGKRGILVFSPQGMLLGEIVLGNVVSNLAFGEDEAKKSVLYITAKNELIKIELP